MTQTETTYCTLVYLEHDAAPISTTLSVEAVADAISQAHHRNIDGPVFIRLPSPGFGDALVRPSFIAAVLPTTIDEDDDDE